VTSGRGGGIVPPDAMMLAPTRLLAAPLAVALALAPLGAAASPYRVLAAPIVSTSPGAPAEAPAEPPVPGGSCGGPESAATATSPALPLSNDPALEYRRGEQAYALGNYEQAVRHFEHSYELSNFAELLYNLGKAYAQWYDLKNDLSLLRKAKRLFQNYTKRLTENPEMDQSQRAEAEAQITRLDEQIAAEEARQVVPPPVVRTEPVLDVAPEQPPPDAQAGVQARLVLGRDRRARRRRRGDGGDRAHAQAGLRARARQHRPQRRRRRAQILGSRCRPARSFTPSPAPASSVSGSTRPRLAYQIVVYAAGGATHHAELRWDAAGHAQLAPLVPDPWAQAELLKLARVLKHSQQQRLTRWRGPVRLSWGTGHRARRCPTCELNGGGVVVCTPTPPELRMRAQPPLDEPPPVEPPPVVSPPSGQSSSPSSQQMHCEAPRCSPQ
jgi:tetratricopeptide (TPR) repeat protein